MLNQYEWLHEHIADYSTVYTRESFDISHPTYVEKKKNDIKRNAYKKFCENLQYGEKVSIYHSLETEAKRSDRLEAAIDFFKKNRKYDVETDEMKENYGIIAKEFQYNMYAAMIGMFNFVTVYDNMDILFISLDDGDVPLGYYRQTREVEAVYKLEEKIKNDGTDQSIEGAVNGFYNKFVGLLTDMSVILHREGILREIPKPIEPIDEKSNVSDTKLISIRGIGKKRGVLNVIIGAAIAICFLRFFILMPKEMIKEDWRYLIFLALDIYFIFKGITTVLKGVYQYRIQKGFEYAIGCYDIARRMNKDRFAEMAEQIVSERQEDLVENARRGIAPDLSLNENFLKTYDMFSRWNLLCDMTGDIGQIHGRVYQHKRGKLSSVASVAVLAAAIFASSVGINGAAAGVYRDFCSQMYNGFKPVDNRIYFNVNADLYKKPSMESDILATVPANTIVSLTDKKKVSLDVWEKIRYKVGDKVYSGWIPPRTVTDDGVEHNISPIYYHNLPSDSKEYSYIPVSSVSASSYLAGQNADYVPELMTDSSASTCWQDGSVGNGVGEELRFKFAAPQEIAAIKVYPGAGNVKAYSENNRLRDVVIKIGGKKIEYTFADRAAYQVIWLDKPIYADSVEIDVDSVYEGNVYDGDLCIAEVMFYKKN